MTALQLSLAHTTVEIGGMEVTGWSEDSDALMMPMDADFFNVKMGANGDILAINNGSRGGEVTIKLLPNSAAAPFFMRQWYQIYHENAIIQWNGFVHDMKNGVKFDLLNGVMMKGPKGITMGAGDMSNHMFTWHFREIEIDYALNTFEDTTAARARLADTGGIAVLGAAS